MIEGDFIRKPDRRVKLLVITQCLWVATLLVLALWWGTLLRQQSDEIANLQTQLGVPDHQIQDRLDRTTRMIAGESGTFILLLFITNGILLFFFIRDSRRSRSLQAFFASITHEFRTPLTSIKLQAEALKDIEDNPKHTPFVNRLLEDVERLEGQVQETLELARIEAGGLLNRESIDIKNFIQNRIAPQYAFAAQKLKMDFELSEACIFADRTSLNIIFRNLIDNALKYSISRETHLHFQGASVDQTYRLSVTHLNSQFSANKPDLGKLFYRGTNSQGAGVGLYLIRVLMEKMKGRSSFLPGTHTFEVSLNFDLDLAGEDGMRHES